MSSTTHEGLLIGLPDIAEIAGVRRNAVSNWRKRHSDFPTPVVDTPSGQLFDAGDVETWLIENGKIAGRIPAASLLWSAFDSLRSELEPREIGDFVTGLLVYLEASERVDLGAFGDLPDEVSWSKVREHDDSRLTATLMSAASSIEQTHPDLAGLMTQGLQAAGRLAPASVRRVCELFDRASSGEDVEVTRADLFEEARDRNHELSRFSEEIASPAAVEHLLARLASGVQSIFDPACGEAGALLLAGQVQAFEYSTADSPVWPDLIGWDINERACSLARARFFVYGVDADISQHNSLRETPPRDVEVVIADPPYGLRDWGDADLYTDQRWIYGAPPPKCADLAWIQIALEALAGDGSAFVVLPPGSLFRSGREAEIRRALVEAGVVEAIVRLPARLRRDTSIPLALWCLRSPEAVGDDREILMVDASRLGTSGRSTVTLDQAELDAVLTVLLTWTGARLVEVDDPRLEVNVVGIDELDESNLDPARYRTGHRVDLEVLMGERTDALNEVRLAHDRANVAMVRLLEELEGQS